MTGNKRDRREELAADIKRQVGTETTKRFLRTLPAFHLQADTARASQGAARPSRRGGGQCGRRRAPLGAYWKMDTTTVASRHGLPSRDNYAQ